MTQVVEKSEVHRNLPLKDINAVLLSSFWDWNPFAATGLKPTYGHGNTCKENGIISRVEEPMLWLGYVSISQMREFLSRYLCLSSNVSLKIDNTLALADSEYFPKIPHVLLSLI
ncbi:hypothetical protein X798_04949 [Onchocerca flexuosa]|uniref:Uncharacterized protein n=1 Tax=Onchocerca flexuosa TaxID=387005 RepID=A0A238BRS9_9BILA|nr:hypothetical protein X798_04949 [Onchocerca flexuosa]